MRLSKKGVINVSKKWLFALLTGASLALLAGCTQDVTVQTGEGKNNAITVEGVAEVEVAPDMAYLLLTVETKDEDSAVAKNNEAKASKEVIGSLKEAGVKEKEIETKNYQIHQYRDYFGMENGKEQSKEVYHVSHQIKVTVSDVTKVSGVLEAVAGKKFVQISSVNYDVKEKEAHIQEAMKKATKNAESRAKAIAEATDTSVKSLNAIKVLSTQQAMYGERALFNDTIAEKSEQTPINPEMQTIHITVEATYNTK